MKTSAEKQRDIVQRLARLPDTPARIEWLIEQARQRPLLEAALRTDAHRVEGCLARLWLVPEFRQGRCRFRSESDSLVVKAVAGLLCECYSGRTPEEILAQPPDFLAQLGIARHLTTHRHHGLARVWDHIRAWAEAHQKPTTDKAGETAT